MRQNDRKAASRGSRKEYRKLDQKKYRSLQGRFLVEGVRTVEEALRSTWEIEAVLSADPSPATTIESLCRDRGLVVEQISEGELRKLSGTVSPPGIAAVVRQRDPGEFHLPGGGEGTAMVVALQGVADPGNAGTIVRICDWFGADAVLFDRASVELYNPKVVRATMGSLFHLPVYPVPDLPALLGTATDAGYNVVSTGLEGGIPLDRFSFPRKTILVLGSEAHGVSPECARCSSHTITIPRVGRAESLNVAVACGIILGAYRRG